MSVFVKERGRQTDKDGEIERQTNRKKTEREKSRQVFWQRLVRKRERIGAIERKERERIRARETERELEQERKRERERVFCHRSQLICGVYCMWERFTGVTRCWCMSYVLCLMYRSVITKDLPQKKKKATESIHSIFLFIFFINSKYIFFTIVKWLIKKFALDLCNISFL